MKTPVQKYITLNTGTKMPRIGLGISRTFDKEIMIKSISEIGYRHIDTAAWYKNEEILGDAIQEV